MVELFVQTEPHIDLNGLFFLSKYGMRFFFNYGCLCFYYLIPRLACKMMMLSLIKLKVRRSFCGALTAFCLFVHFFF